MMRRNLLKNKLGGRCLDSKRLYQGAALRVSLHGRPIGLSGRLACCSYNRRREKTELEWRSRLRLHSLHWNVTEKGEDSKYSRLYLSLPKPEFFIENSILSMCYDLYINTRRCWGSSTRTLSIVSEFYPYLFWVWGMVFVTMGKQNDIAENNRKSIKKILVYEPLLSKEQDGNEPAYFHYEPNPTMVDETLKGGKLNKPTEAGSPGSVKEKRKRKIDPSTFLEKMYGITENILHLKETSFISPVLGDPFVIPQKGHVKAHWNKIYFYRWNSYSTGMHPDHKELNMNKWDWRLSKRPSLCRKDIVGENSKFMGNMHQRDERDEP